MRRTVWLVMLIAACSKSEPKEAPRLVEADELAGAVQVKKKKPSAEIPDWASIEVDEGGPPARPIAWVGGARPTLAMFSASWCPGCTASAFAERRLAKTYGKDFQIGVALQDESDDAFAKSPYAKALSGVPVWSEESVTALSGPCHPSAIPAACLVDQGKVLWSGDPSEAGAVLEAHKAGKLEAWLDSEASANETVRTLAREALTDATKIAGVVGATHGRVGWQNSIAWSIVDRDVVSPGGAALAVALARDAVASDGGIDFAHLDTYALALSKAGRAEDAAYVGARVIAVCEAVHGHCTQERRRAQEFIDRAAKRTN